MGAPPHRTTPRHPLARLRSTRRHLIMTTMSRDRQRCPGDKVGGSSMSPDHTRHPTSPGHRHRHPRLRRKTRPHPPVHQTPHPLPHAQAEAILSHEPAVARGPSSICNPRPASPDRAEPADGDLIVLRGPRDTPTATPVPRHSTILNSIEVPSGRLRICLAIDARNFIPSIASSGYRLSSSNSPPRTKGSFGRSRSPGCRG